MTEKTDLEKRIIAERLDKVAAIPKTVKSLAKNPEAVSYDLVIQRNLAWTEEQKSALIESILLGYPIPPVYTLRSTDAVLQAIDGKQRLTTLTSYVNNGFKLKGLNVVYGLDINDRIFNELPEEFQELIRDQNLIFYQFETLTNEQRDQLFKRLNSGTALTPVMLTRAVLGSDLLQFVKELTETDFMQKTSVSLKQKEKFVDQELVLQMLGIITERNFDVSSKGIRNFVLDLHTNGVTDEEKDTIEGAFQFLSEAFKDIDDKDKKILKKNDVVGITGAVMYTDECSPDDFANLIIPYIRNQSLGSRYSNTKSSGSAKSPAVQDRINLLRGVIVASQRETA